MKYITEAYLRDLYKKEAFTKYYAQAGIKFTPSALTYLNERKIPILFQDEKGYRTSKETPPQRLVEGKYVVLETGTSLEEKPEHMTHIYGNCLVEKTHPRILFRGKLDTLIAEITAFQCKLPTASKWLAEDLEAAVAAVRLVIRGDVTGEALEETAILGMDEAKLRAFSHYPEKYFGIPHIRVHYSLGETICGLNLLRVKAREAELAGVAAFPIENSRADILQMMNRLSSFFYILMLRIASGHNSYPKQLLEEGHK